MLLQLTEKFSHPTEYGSRKISATTPPPPQNMDPGKCLLLPHPPNPFGQNSVCPPPQMDVGPYAYAYAHFIRSLLAAIGRFWT